MKKYILSADAELDLESIWDYIAEDNIDAADRWIEKLFESFEMLERSPGMGTNARTSLHFRFCSVRSQSTWSSIEFKVSGSRSWR